MLPNPKPLIVPGQFGILGALHSSRVDLGLGQASGVLGQSSWQGTAPRNAAPPLRSTTSRPVCPSRRQARAASGSTLGQHRRCRRFGPR